MKQEQAEQLVRQLKDAVVQRLSGNPTDDRIEEAVKASIEVFATTLVSMAPNPTCNMKEEDKAALMTRLAESFPSLRGRGAGDGIRPWNSLRLEEVSKPWSMGQKHAADFLLGVWNHGDYGDRFKFFEALQNKHGTQDILQRSWHGFATHFGARGTST